MRILPSVILLSPLMKIDVETQRIPAAWFRVMITERKRESKSCHLLQLKAMIFKVEIREGAGEGYTEVRWLI